MSANQLKRFAFQPAALASGRLGQRAEADRWSRCGFLFAVFSDQDEIGLFGFGFQCRLQRFDCGSLELQMLRYFH